MSEESEFWGHVKEVRKKERAEKEPQRIERALQELRRAGFTPKQVDDTLITMSHNGATLRFWPYTGYWACKGMGSGRGLRPLLRKLNHNGRLFK